MCFTATNKNEIVLIPYTVENRVKLVFHDLALYLGKDSRKSGMHNMLEQLRGAGC